jgi:hypothetical protein
VHEDALPRLKAAVLEQSLPRIAANCSISSLQVSGWADAACSPEDGKSNHDKGN